MVKKDKHPDSDRAYELLEEVEAAVADVFFYIDDLGPAIDELLKARHALDDAYDILKDYHNGPS